MEGRGKRNRSSSSVVTSSIVSYLNLHEVIPSRDIRKMIYAYLDKDDREMVKCAHNAKREKGKKFFVACAAKGILSLLEEHKTTLDELISNAKVWDRYEITMAQAASKSGQLSVLKWLQQNYSKKYFVSWCIDAALRSGQQRVIEYFMSCDSFKWVNGVGIVSIKDDDEPTTYGCHKALKSGNLDFIRWNEKNSGFKVSLDYYCLKNAISSGNSAVVKYILSLDPSEDCKDEFSGKGAIDELFHTALKKGNASVLDMLCSFFNIRTPRGFSTRVLNVCRKRYQDARFNPDEIAASYDNVQVLDWLLGRGYKISFERCITAAATYNCLRVFRWCYEKDPSCFARPRDPPHYIHCTKRAARGNVVKQGRAGDVDPDQTTAVVLTSLSMLKWGVAKGVDIDFEKSLTQCNAEAKEYLISITKKNTKRIKK